MTQFLSFRTDGIEKVDVWPLIVKKKNPGSPEVVFYRDHDQKNSDFYTVMDVENHNAHDMFDNAFHTIQKEGIFENTTIYRLLKSLVHARVEIYLWYGSELDDLEVSRSSDEFIETVKSQLSESPGEVYAIFRPHEESDSEQHISMSSEENQ